MIRHRKEKSAIHRTHENGKIKCDTMRAQKKVLSRRRDGIVNSPKLKRHSLYGKHQGQDYCFSQKMQGQAQLLWDGDFSLKWEQATNTLNL